MYARERRDLDVDGRKIRVILARSCPETPCDERSGVLRVKDYKQSVAMESDGASGTKGGCLTEPVTAEGKGESGSGC